MRKKAKIIIGALSCVFILGCMVSCQNNDTPPVGDKEENDYTITFHYGFDPKTATLDSNGKASSYTKTLTKESKDGRKVILTSANINSFNVEGYKQIGYSDNVWSTDNITSDLDIYVLYAKLQDFTITFQNPDGSTITTITKQENSTLLEEDYPSIEDVKVDEGLSFLKRDNVPADGIVKDNLIIKAVQGTSKLFEAEKAQKMYYVGYEDMMEETPVILSSGGSGGSSVYFYDNWEKEENGKKHESIAPVAIEFNFEVTTAVKLDLNVSVWNRKGATDSNLNSFMKVEVGQNEVYSPITIQESLTCSDEWGDFQDVFVNEIEFKPGVNTIKITGNSGILFNMDYITLSGDAEKISYPKHTVTLLGGATFENGETTARIEEQSGFPEGIVTPVVENKYVDGWYVNGDKTTVVKKDEFKMPNYDITLEPHYSDGKKITINANRAQRFGEGVTVSDPGFKMYNDFEQKYETETTWIEYTFTTDSTMDVLLSLNVRRRAQGFDEDGSVFSVLDLMDVYIKQGDKEEKIEKDKTGELYKDVVDELSPFDSEIGPKAIERKVATLNLVENTTYTLRIHAKCSSWERAFNLDHFIFNNCFGDIKEPILPNETKAIKEVENIGIDGVKDEAYQLVGRDVDWLITGKTPAPVSGSFYMSYKGNNAYIYVEVKDNIVATRGKDSRNESVTNFYENDQIEFWFGLNEKYYKVAIDAFGYGLLSTKDGNAEVFENASKIEYKTQLIGANLEDFSDGSPCFAAGATGYSIEFSLPLLEETETLKNNDLMTSIQFDSIDDADGGNFCAFGHQLKTEEDLERVDRVFPVHFE